MRMYRTYFRIILFPERHKHHQVSEFRGFLAFSELFYVVMFCTARLDRKIKVKETMRQIFIHENA